MNTIAKKERLIWIVFALLAIPSLIVSNLAGGFNIVLTIVIAVIGVLAAIKGIIEMNQNNTNKGLVCILLAVVAVMLVMIWN